MAIDEDTRKQRKKEADRRSYERRVAKKLGLEGPPLQRPPFRQRDDEDRKRRAVEAARQWRQRNLDKQRAMARTWKAENKQRVAQYRAAYFVANKAQERENNIRFHAQNPDLKAGYDKAHHAKHGDKIRAQRASKEARARINRWTRERRASDPGFDIMLRLRGALGQAMRMHGKGRKTVAIKELIGCTISELCDHLEQQFTEAMTWENRGRSVGRTGWEIDHIRPCASFDLTQVEQQRECFHFSNLQPLWGLENARKGARLFCIEDSIDP